MSLSDSAGGAMPLPKLAWDFNGTTTDYVSGLAPTTTTGTITYGSGKYLQSVVFTNTAGSTASNALTYTLSSITSLTNGFTVACWFKINSVPPSGQRSGIWRVPATGTGNGGAYMLYYASGQTNFGYTQTDQVITYVEFNANFGALAVGTWYHAVYTISGTSQTAYLNGVLKATDSRLTATYTLTNPTMSLGFHGSFGDAFNGEVDDLRIYNTALTAAQVSSIWAQQGVPGRGAVQVSSGALIPLPKYISSNVIGTNITGSTLQPFTPFGNGSIYLNTDPTTYITWTAATLASATNFTLETWTNYKNFTNASSIWNGGGKVPCLFNDVANVTLASFYFGPTTAGTVGLYYWSGSQDIYAESSITIAVNTWNHIALTYDGTTYRIFINGVLAATNTKTGGGMFLSYGMRIGSHKFTNQSPNANVQAYITSSRFVTGAIVYPTSSTTIGASIFTPPTAPLTTYSSGATSMLLNVPVAPLGLTGTPLFTQLSTSATSSAVGAFSLRAVNGTSARAVQVRPVAAFPPTGFTSAVTNPGGNQFNQTLTGYPFGGSGTYTANCSSFAGDVNQPRPWKVFDYDTLTWWENNYGVETGYNGIGATSANTYSGSYTTTVSGSAVGGEWIQLGFPTAIVLYSYSMYNRFGYNGFRMPYAWTVAGSNDGTTWATVDSQTGIIWTSATQTFTTTSTTTYLYFRLIVRAIQSNGNTNQPVNIGQWTLNGSNASWNTDFYADRLGNLLTAPVTGQSLASWLGGATGYVTTWYDQSGAGNHMSCSSAGIQPKIDLVNNFIDLKTSAYFDVSAGTTGPVPFQSGKNYTVVFRHGQFNGSGLFCATQNAAGPYGNLVNNFKKGTGSTYTQYWYGNDVNNKGVLATGNRVSYKWDGTNRSLYVNGTLADATASSGWAQTSSSIQMIGKTNFDATMNGELYGAFMFTSALSDTDRTLLENFL